MLKIVDFSFVDKEEISLLKKEIFPEKEGSKPVMVLSSVDFPSPFLPISVTKLGDEIRVLKSEITGFLS